MRPSTGPRAPRVGTGRGRRTGRGARTRAWPSTRSAGDQRHGRRGQRRNGSTATRASSLRRRAPPNLSGSGEVSVAVNGLLSMNSAHLLLLSWVVAASGRPLATVAPRRREANVAPRRREQRVLMLISDTGGGHRASAMALEAMIKDLRPSQVDCKIVDIWTEYGAWPDNQMPRTYPFLCRHPMLWRLMFHASPLLERPWFAATRLTCGEKYRRCIT